MTEMATINGTELAYVEEGRGEPVVFVHGGVGDFRTWEQQMPTFAAAYHAIAVSCRGAWPNRKLGPNDEITLDTFVDDVAGFIKTLKLPPVHLVGHSSPGAFGGLLLAQRHPELLRTLVLLEPPAFPVLGVNIPPAPQQLMRLMVRHPRAGLGFVRFGAKGVRPAMKAFERGDDESGLRIFMSAVAGRDRVDAIPVAVFQTFVDNVGPLKAQLRAGFPRFSALDARSIHVPTLLVSGTETSTPLLAVTDKLEHLVPNVERLTIAGASHNMFNSHPKQFNDGVIKFLREH